MQVCEQLRHIMHVIQQNINDDQSMIDKASATTYTSGALTALWGFVTSQEFGIFFGIFIGSATYLLTWWYKQKDLEFKRADERRKQELHEATMQAMANNAPENIKEE